MPCISCGFVKDRYYTCSKCHGTVCHKCITEGMCVDCYMQTYAKVKSVMEEYDEKADIA